MKEKASRHKTTLEALNFVDKYVSDLKSLAKFDVREFLKVERQIQATLDQEAFPREVRSAIDRTISSALESYIVIGDLLEEKHEREQIRREEERRLKKASICRWIGKVFSIILSATLGVVLVIKDEPGYALGALFLTLYILGDALPLKLWLSVVKKD